MEQDERTIQNAESPIDLFPTVCPACKEKNLTEQIYHATCSKCSNIYCTHFASSVDPQYCINCCHAVEMAEQIVHKKAEHYSEEKDKVYTKTSKARQIKFGGLDWLFYQRKIETLSDVELLMAIEYHRAIYNSMMFERDKRRAEHFHRNANKKFVVPTSSDPSITTTTSVKHTRTIKSKSAAEAKIKAMMELLLKQGMTAEQIMKAMGGGK